MRRPDHDRQATWLSILVDQYGLTLFLILVAALLLRLTTIDFGLPALNDPDELMFELGALRMLRGPTLNPGWFGHPATTTIYVLALVDISAFGAALLLGRATSIKAFGALVYADPSWMILPGRVAMALFGIATIALTSQLTRRYFGPGAGLAAAVLLAFNPVHITYSQIIRSDMMACFFMLLCMKEATTIAERGNRRAYGYTALWLGLAIATKWPFVLSGLAIVGATIVAIRGGILDQRQGLVRLMGAGIAASTVLLLASPFLLLDYATVLRNLQGESQVHHLGATSEGFWWNLRWYAAGPILQGFGWIGIGLIMVGAWRLPRHRAALAVIAPLTAGFLLLLSIQHLVWERWALPLMPLGAIVAGLGLATVVRLPRDQGWERIVPWVAAMALILVLVPLAAQVRADDRTRANDTRQLASAWVRTNVAPGSTVLVEHFAFDLLDEPWRFLFPLGDMGCVDARAFLRGKVAYATIERARAGRSNIDLGTVSPAKLATCHADVAILTQYSRYQRERDRFPAEYAAYQTLIRSGQVAAVFSPQRGQVGGPTVTIITRR